MAVLDAFNAIDAELKKLKAEVYDWRQRAEKAERALAELRSTPPQTSEGDRSEEKDIG